MTGLLRDHSLPDLTSEIEGSLTMPEWFDAEVAALEVRSAERKAADRPVLLYGSSTFTLWGDAADHFPGHAVVNHGFGGSTLADCLEYFDRLVTPMRPSVVVLYAGDNDLDQGTTPEAVLAMLRAFIERKREALGSLPLAYVSIKVIPARMHFTHRIAYTNLIVERALRGQPDVTYLDVTRRMVGRGLIPWQSFYGSDPLHMNAAGYLLWVRAIGEYLDSLQGDTSDRGGSAAPAAANVA
jgi:lysophospholipase L1-like esterase